MTPTKLLSAALVSLGFILPLALKAQIVPVLAPGSSWEYTTQNPTGSASWATSTGGGWSVGLAPFGNANYNDPNFFPNSPWAANGSTADDLWVRKAINLSSYNLNSINWGLGVDNGYKLYLNGTLISAGFAEGYTYRWEYTGAFASNLLVSGINYVALALNDTGGYTAFDMQVTGTRLPVAAVPEPATYGLLGAASLAALVAVRRRRVAGKVA